ncbi:DUF559 domain-containing protein [Nocardia tengchongensis]|uniref:DUF559 domain-containing protein n=1 Tax=Nocardia tengchongensis TaxID=2055889 RepID=UPI0036AAD64A
MIRTRAELRADGIPGSTIDYRCRQGSYTRLLPAIYCTVEPTTLVKCHAVITWLPFAVLSHRTAAWLAGMLGEPPHIEATAPSAIRRKTPPWLHLYRRDLRPDWIDISSDLPMTTAARTLLDCIGVLPKSEAEALVDSHAGHTVRPQDLLDLCSGLHGSPALRARLRAAAAGFASEPERIFARAMRERDIRLLPNHPVGQYRCDFVDERSSTIIEIDGHEFHSTPGAFRHDRRRQNALALEGWFILRYAAADVFQHLDACADEAAAAIRHRRRTHWRP